MNSCDCCITLLDQKFSQNSCTLYIDRSIKLGDVKREEVKKYDRDEIDII